MNNSPFLIATRNSKLALWQAEWVLARLQQFDHNHNYELLPMVSTGDIKLQTMLARVGGKGLFTLELEQALQEQRAICAVHSLKDVPMTTEDCYAWAYTERASVEDLAIFSERSGYKSLDDLPANAIVGTSSVRRQALLAHYYPHLQVKLLRGNVQTRLAKLNDPEQNYSAILLAKAGVERLEILDSLVYEELTAERWTPAPGQGIVTIQYLANSSFTEVAPLLQNNIGYLSNLIERGIAKELGGSCSLPLGVHLTFHDSSQQLIPTKQLSAYAQAYTDARLNAAIASTSNVDSNNLAKANPDSTDLAPVVSKFNLETLGVKVFMADLKNVYSITKEYQIALQDLHLDSELNVNTAVIAAINSFITQVVAEIKADKFEQILELLEKQLDEQA